MRRAEIKIEVSDHGTVSGLCLRPAKAWACLVLAHGAGAGMRHPWMTDLAEELGRLGIATLRYNFPYMEQGSKRPDRPPVAHATVRAACARAERLAGKLPLYAGGKSFGGRMTSQAQALRPLAKVRGLAFFGFPLHPAGKPSKDRGAHLTEVKIPMLFLQGTKDALAKTSLLKSTVDALRSRATLILVPGADHTFHVPLKSGRTDQDVRAGLAEATAKWMKKV